MGAVIGEVEGPQRPPDRRHDLDGRLHHRGGSGLRGGRRPQSVRIAATHAVLCGPARERSARLPRSRRSWSRTRSRSITTGLPKLSRPPDRAAAGRGHHAGPHGAEPERPLLQDRLGPRRSPAPVPIPGPCRDRGPGRILAPSDAHPGNVSGTHAAVPERSPGAVRHGIHPRSRSARRDALRDLPTPTVCAATGNIPAVLYGMKRRNLDAHHLAERGPGAVPEDGQSHLVELRLGDETRPAILREMQIRPRDGPHPPHRLPPRRRGQVEVDTEHAGHLQGPRQGRGRGRRLPGGEAVDPPCSATPEGTCRASYVIDINAIMGSG